MRRRTLLATTGASIVGFAGCLDTPTAGGGDGTPNKTPTTEEGDPPPTSSGGGSTTEEPSTEDDTTTYPEVTLQFLHLQYGVVVPNSPDSIGVFNPDTPYVLAQVAVDGDLPRSDFTLAIGDHSFDPTILDRYYLTDWGDYRWYENGQSGGLLLFELSPGEYSGDVGLTWPGDRQGVDAPIVSRLAAGPPGFSASFSLPETHDSVDAPPVDIEVTNEEDIERRFLGALNRVGPLVAYYPVTKVSKLVGPGETVTVTVSDAWSGMPGDDRLGDGEPDVTYRLQYASGEAEAQIRLVESA